MRLGSRGQAYRGRSSVALQRNRNRRWILPAIVKKCCINQYPPINPNLPSRQSRPVPSISMAQVTYELASKNNLHDLRELKACPWWDPMGPNRTKGQYWALNHYEPLWSVVNHYESHLSSVSQPQADRFLWGCGPQRQESLQELSRRSGWISQSIRSTYRKITIFKG